MAAAWQSPVCASTLSSSSPATKCASSSRWSLGKHHPPAPVEPALGRSQNLHFGGIHAVAREGGEWRGTADPWRDDAVEHVRCAPARVRIGTAVSDGGSLSESAVLIPLVPEARQERRTWHAGCFISRVPGATEGGQRRRSTDATQERAGMATDCGSVRRGDAARVWSPQPDARR
jgi:hypothetical protein